MRLIYFVSVIVLISATHVFGEDTLPKNKLEKNVLTLLKKWREGGRGPFQFPLPSLNVVTAPETCGEYRGLGVSISYSTSPLKLVGLKDFFVEKIDISEQNLKASGVFAVPRLDVSADKYQIKGTVFSFIPIKGAGKMNIVISDIRITFSIRLGNDSAKMWVDTLRLSFTVGNVKANLQGGPSAVAVILNKSGTSILRSNHDDIVRTVHDLIKPAINCFIKDLTLDQLFKLVEDPEETVS